MKRVLPWLPSVGWAGLLFLASSLPTIPGVPDLPHVDKAGHFGVYLVLGFLLAHAVAASGWRPLVAVLLGMAYGITDELHQLFVPGRSSSVLDWLADAAGVCVGVYLHTRFRARRRAARGLRPTDPTALRA